MEQGLQYYSVALNASVKLVMGFITNLAMWKNICSPRSNQNLSLQGPVDSRDPIGCHKTQRDPPRSIL